MGLTYELAKFVVEKGYSNFSKEEVRAAKDLILDALGVMIGGSSEPVTQRTIKYVKDSGGTAECGIIGGGLQTSLTNAVLVNGTSQHAQELESEGVNSGSLPMTNIPVALNVAKSLNYQEKRL